MSAVDYAAIFESIVPERCLETDVMPGSRTNVNVRVRTPEGAYAMRVPGEGTNEYINRPAEVANVVAAGQLSFTPEVVYADGESGVLVTRFLVGAESLTTEAYADDGMVCRMCAILAELHGSGISFSNAFDLAEGVRRYREVLAREGYGLQAELVAQQDRLDAGLESLLTEYAMPMVPSHGDPNAANFMWDGNRMWLIDWEYSGMADPYFDLSNVVLTDCLDETAEACVLAAYENASGVKIDPLRWSLFKAAIDYMWLFWHLIKLSRGQMIDYNEAAWRRRLDRALANLNKIGF